MLVWAKFWFQVLHVRPNLRLCIWGLLVCSPGITTDFLCNVTPLTLTLVYLVLLVLSIRPCLIEFLILAPLLLVGASRPLLLDPADNGRPTLLTVLQLVDPLGEYLAGVLAVLVARPGGLGLDDDARGDVSELDRRVCLVLRRMLALWSQKDEH